MTATKPRTRARSSKPATGVCCWLPSLDDRRTLEIRTETATDFVVTIYDVFRTTTGYRLLTHTGPRKGEVYNVDREFRCDCPDARYHRTDRCLCKHARALRAALAANPWKE